MSRPDPEGTEQGSIDAPKGVLEDARTAVADVGGAALEDASRAAAGAGARVRTEIDTRSTDAGDRLATVAGDLRAVADGLAERGSAQPAKLAAQASQQSNRLSNYLKESDPDRLLADAEDLMRRQPAAVAAGAALAGFVAARFLKASAHRRYVQRGDEAADRASGLPPAEPGGVDLTNPAPATGAGAAQAVD